MSHSDDIFVSEVKAKELMITGSSNECCFSYSNGKIKMWIFLQRVC